MPFNAIGSAIIGANIITVTPTIGDITVVSVNNTWNPSTGHVWGISGGGVTTWHLFQNTAAEYQISSTEAFGTAIFWGVVTSSGSSSITNNGGDYNGCLFIWQEFSSTYPVVEDNRGGSFATSSGYGSSGNYASIVPGSIGELFLGSFNDPSGTTVNTPTYAGFVYDSNASTQFVYSLSVSEPNSYSPPWSIVSNDYWVTACGCLVEVGYTTQVQIV